MQYLLKTEKQWFQAARGKMDGQPETKG